MSPAVIHELSEISRRLQSGAGGLRWMAPESWHITLQFLGNRSEEQYECAVARLRAIHLPPVSIKLDALGVFDRTGIVFAGVRLSPQLVQLQERVTAATEPCGFVAETRPYHPHITLARLRGNSVKAQSRPQSKAQPQPAAISRSNSGAHPLRTLQQRISPQPAFPRFHAEEFLLYQSHLSPTGSTYEIRHRFKLTH